MIRLVENTGSTLPVTSGKITPTQPDLNEKIDLYLEQRRMRITGEFIDTLESWDFPNQFPADALERIIGFFDDKIRLDNELILQVTQKASQESQKLITNLADKLVKTRQQLQRALELLDLAAKKITV